MTIQNDGPNLNGPESMPLQKIVNTFPMVISVYKIGEDIAIKTERIDYSNFEHRKWLGRITYWACSSGYLVETMSAADFDKEAKSK